MKQGLPASTKSELAMKLFMGHYLRWAKDHAEDNNVLEQDRIHILLAFQRAYSEWQNGRIPMELAATFVSSVNSFARFLGYRGELQERINWGKQALEVAEQTGQLSAVAELCASTIAWPLLQIGNHEEAKKYCEQGIQAARQSKEPRWMGEAARTLSGIARDQNRGDESKDWAKRAFRYGREARDKRVKRGAVLDLGYAALLHQNYTAAERRFRLLLNLAKEDDDKERMANRSVAVAIALLDQGLTEEPFHLYQSALALGEELESEVIMGEAESLLGKIEQVRGDASHAKELALSATRRFERVGIRRQSRAEQFVVLGSR